MPDSFREDEFFERLASHTGSPVEPAPDSLKQRLIEAFSAEEETEQPFFENFAGVPPSATAPSTLKSKIYSALLVAQAAEGPLLPLADCRAAGGRLCVFEELVRVAPVGEVLHQTNYCRVCHARVLGEKVEGAPIYWPGCPYVQFQNR